MFSGLSDYLKKILPKRLFFRALLIVAIAVLVLQLSPLLRASSLKKLQGWIKAMARLDVRRILGA